ncbi:hypothetical protein [Microbacterium maritypicum]
MDVLSILGTIAAALVLAAAVWIVVAFALIAAAYRLAAAQEQIPASLDCRDRRHIACLGCSCSCHT